MGMSPGNESMWLSLSSDREARKAGAPSTFEAQLTPWWGPPSELTYRNNEIAMGMGYDILRLQGMKSSLSIDGEEFEGTAYFQKVTVQAPSVPWFWGMVHFDDGSYLDWFMPHLTPLSTAKDKKLEEEGQPRLARRGRESSMIRQGGGQRSLIIARSNCRSPTKGYWTPRRPPSDLDQGMERLHLRFDGHKRCKPSQVDLRPAHSNGINQPSYL